MRKKPSQRFEINARAARDTDGSPGVSAVSENRRVDMQDAMLSKVLRLHTLTDPELVRLAQDGDAEAFGELVTRYQSKIYRLARRLTDTQEDAEDVLQEAFIRAFKAVKGFKGDSKFSTWLYRITVNFAAMKRRAKRNNVESLDRPIPTKDGEVKRELMDSGNDPLKDLIAKEIGEVLDTAISRLTPTNRAVFVLRHVEGLSTEETKEILNISISAVKSRLHRTRSTLQRDITRLAHEEARAVCTV
jgi:RNA polymerase sigma-70 factor (ECF subfamily)